MNLKSLFLLSVILAVNLNITSAQTLPAKTTWEGNLGNIKIRLRVFDDNLTKQSKAEFDVPQQGASGLNVSKLVITNDSLTADCQVMASMFSAAFNAAKTELSGRWKQRGANIPIVLKRVANINRPQMPKGPFPYLEEKVVYYNQDKSIKYGATLTLPKATKPATAVILITGSGQEDRDETAYGHKPFWVIADHLSRNGIAVLRVDDRGIGESTGDVMNATSADFAKDVLVSIDFLKNHTGIDPKNIGLIGHSEGGVIAPLVAVQSHDVAFIVSLAGVGVKGVDIFLRQSKDFNSAAGFKPDEVERMVDLSKMMLKLLADYPDKNEAKQAFAKSITAWIAQQPEDFLTKAKLKGAGSVDFINLIGESTFSPWKRYFSLYDPSTTLAKITIPVLALNGEKDMQVRADENLAGFNKLLTQAGNKNFKTISLPGLNHFFQHAETGSIGEYEKIEETISPEVLDIITKWIQGLKPRK